MYIVEFSAKVNESKMWYCFRFIIYKVDIKIGQKYVLEVDMILVQPHFTNIVHLSPITKIINIKQIINKLR